jgi:hypothetical protein
MIPLLFTERLSAADALPLAELGWRELGIPEADVVGAVRGEETAYYKVNRARGCAPAAKEVQA